MPISYTDLDGAEPDKRPDNCTGFAEAGGKGSAENPIRLKEVSVRPETSNNGGLPYIPKFSYNGSFMDYIAAIDNAAIGILNTIPALWNSVVANYHSIKGGTWGQDMINELQAIWNSVKTWAKSEYNYTTQTPIGSQFSDFGRNITSPQFVEFAAPFVMGVAASRLTTASTTTNTATVAAKGGVQYTKSSLQQGQQMHKAYKVGDRVPGVAIKEFRDIPGIRPDFVDFSKKRFMN
jgi:hypothetical protein